MKYNKKSQSDVLNLGRSMVEMLGVLAIIGVLSAGALKGYSAAMFRHKVNQTVDIFQGVLQRLMELDQQNLGDDFSITTSQKMIDYGLLQSCQEVEGITYDYTSGCKLPIGSLEMDISIYDPYLAGVLWVNFTDAKSCIAFSSVGWEKALPVDWGNPAGRINISGTGTGNTYDYLLNDTIDMSKLSEACNRLCAKGECAFELIIREY